VSDNPPIPEVAPAAPAEGGSVLAELWKNIFPWDDLNAKGPPERWLKLGLEILPALAVLAAQGADAPHLLQVDALGRLAATGTPNIAGKLLQPVAAGAKAVVVDQPELFPPGSFITFSPGPQNFIFSVEGWHLITNVNGNTISLAEGPTNSWGPGDIALGGPGMVIVGPPPGYLAATSLAQGRATVGAGATRNLVIATASGVYRLHSVDFTIDAVTAGGGVYLHLQDTAGNDIDTWRTDLAPPYTGLYQALPIQPNRGFQVKADAAIALNWSLRYSISPASAFP
jgi:hypothetical protein